MTTIALGHPQAPPRSRRASAARERPAAVVRQPARVRTRLTRRGRVVLAALIVVPLLIGGGVILAGGGAIAAIQGSSMSYAHVTVQPGDSLWSIAERVAPRSDPRDVIAAFVDLNGLSSSTVQAGQQLAVPPQFDGVAR